MHPGAEHDEPDIARLQRRTLTVLIAGQVLGGAATASGIAVSTLLARDILGGDTLAGAAFAATTFGSAAAAVPLSRRMARLGRRPGLTLGYRVAAIGAVLAIAAAEAASFVLLLAGLVLFGSGTAANLLARYAAADLAPPDQRARSISLVVFATTIGAVAGPNIIDPAGSLAATVGIPRLAGPFLIALACFALAATVSGVFLRPDPLEVAGLLGSEGGHRPSIRQSLSVVLAVPGARLGLATMVASHGVMVSVMTMTPLHMRDGGDSLRLIGLVISLHIAGMYALSPVVGWLADRVGRLPVALTAAAILVTATLVSAQAGHAHGGIASGLFLLGLGWSFGVISGSALLTDAVDQRERAGVQGVADLAMGATAGTGGLAAGVIVGALGYATLSLIGTAIATALLLAVARSVVTARTPAIAR